MIINRLGVGDPVEVRRPTMTDNGPVDRWIPATVCHASDTVVDVCFADGTRMAVERGRQLVRRQPIGPRTNPPEEI